MLYLFSFSRVFIPKPATTFARRAVKGHIMSTHLCSTNHESSAKSRIRPLTTGLIAVVALVAALGAAAPAQAHPVTNSGATISFGFSFGTGSNGFQVHSTCMDNRAIKRGMQSQGYSDIRFIHERRPNKPKFSAVWDGWRYTMFIDRCTGRATQVRVERVHLWHRSPGSGFFFEWSLLNPNRH